MKPYEKEVEQAQLDNEKAALLLLIRNYADALDEIKERIAVLQGRLDADMLHVVYQVEYQSALKTEVQSILEKLQSNEFQTVSEYLTKSYTEGHIGMLYILQKQGVPLMVPINQEEVVQAIKHETKLTSSLYTELGLDIKNLQKKIAGEISRGISTASSNTEIARNISNHAKIPMNRAMTISRTEAHRITEDAAANVQTKAKESGADIVKIWDSTLDGKTRPNHIRLDGQIRELEEPFEVGKYKPMRPGGFGVAKEDINCRCRSRCDARWALDAEETKMLGNIDGMSKEQLQALAEKLHMSTEEVKKYSGQIIPINAKDYDDFKRQYNELWHYEET